MHCGYLQSKFHLPHALEDNIDMLEHLKQLDSHDRPLELCSYVIVVTWA